MPRRRLSLRGVAAGLLLDYLAARGTPRRGKWRIAQLFAPFLDGAIIRSSQGPHLYCRFRDSTFWLAARENQQVAALIDDVGPRDLFVDVGANIGLHACYAASRGATVVALEPSHREFHDLLRNRELLTDNERVRFIALPLAAAARTEFVNFRVNHLSHSGGSSMGEVRNAAEEPVVVLSTRVDDVIAQLASHPDLPGVEDAISRRSLVVKIDVEGFEVLVLQGMDELLQEHRCRSVIVEVDRQRSRALGIPDDPDELMGSFGYVPTVDPNQPGCFDQRYIPARDWRPD